MDGASWLERRFRLAERNSTPSTELRAAIATFVVMAYIIFVNPTILSGVTDIAGERLPFSAVMTVTCLSAGCLCILMGWLQMSLSPWRPGMGLNAVVAYQLVGQMKLTWPQAMTVIFVEGLIILLLVVTRFRTAVMKAIPVSQKRALAAGIGMFIALIGFVNSGMVTRGQGTVVTLGRPSGLRVLVFVLGFLLMGWMMIRKVRGALVFGILLTSAVAVLLNLSVGGGNAFGPSAKLSSNWFEFGQGFVGNDAIFGRLDFRFFHVLGLSTALLVIFSVMLSDFFDTMGTVVGLGKEVGLLDHEQFRGIHRVLLVDSLGAVFGGFANSSSNTTYIESAAGISEGGRTGLTAVLVGLFFLGAIFLSPAAAIVPPEATAPGLILVGLLMMTVVQDWTNYGEAIPAFITWLGMPFTYSITNGIGAGFITYTALKILTGKAREVHSLMYLSTAGFVIYFSFPAGP
jgi:AGZA family xanthine/uracil permease-like MFS transporter